MAIITEGYWISPDGKIFEVYDHLDLVRQQPHLFGISKSRVRDEKRAMRNRDKILFDALKNTEWIRVRGHRDYITYEFWGMNEWVIARIRVHIDSLKLSDYTPVVISDLAKKKYFETTAKYIRSEQAMLEVNPKRRKIPRDLYKYYKSNREKFF